MGDDHRLAQEFEAHRGRLRALAYRMLGSLAEADDAVQEAWLRLSGSAGREPENLGAWLTTVTGRICLDMLRSRQARREELHGVYVPDPIICADDALSPEDEAMLADCSLSSVVTRSGSRRSATPRIRTLTSMRMARCCPVRTPSWPARRSPNGSIRSPDISQPRRTAGRSAGRAARSPSWPPSSPAARRPGTPAPMPTPAPTPAPGAGSATLTTAPTTGAAR